MTWFQIYAFYGSPLVVLALGYLTYWIAARELRREPVEHHAPGE